MATFFDRYRGGDCDAVWSDLERLGSAVYQEPYLTDARLVAQETMKRVRHNAELVATRLAGLGYEFAAQRAVTDQFQLIRSSLDYLDRMPADFPAIHSSIRGMNQKVDELRLSRPELLEKLGAMEQSVRQERSKWSATERVVVPAEPSIADDIARYEALAGRPIPLSLKAWCEIVGSVHLQGTHPTLSFCRPQAALFEETFPPFGAAKPRPAPETPPLADPLDINPEIPLEDDIPDTAHRIFLGLDDHLKAGVYKIAEPYYIDVPSPATADAPFRDWHNRNFVSFLRIAFEWGGLPGWERYSERPEKELAYLKEGLLIF